jgi:Holliday junction resolvasome RuvABC endonuclease subunit
MTKTYFKNISILALTPSARGIGFAVLEGHDQLHDWGVKSGKGDKNKVAIKCVKELIASNRPEVIVLPDMKNARRDPRIKALNRQIIAVAKAHRVSVALFSDAQVKKVLLAECKGTRHDLAEMVAKRFPDQLTFHLPPKRDIYKSEDSRIDFFYAVALALTLKLKK